MSNLINKAKDALSGDKNHSTTTSSGYGSGPHDTATGNRIDPTIDSRTGQYTGAHGQTTTTAGPHSSNVGNKVDPRVDSDLDHRNNPTSGVGGYGQTQGTHGGTHGGTGMTSGTGQGYGTSATATGGTAGPHSSNLANKLDPRVDSDVDHRNNPASNVGGYGQTQGAGSYGATGGTSTAPGYGAPSSTGGAHYGGAHHGGATTTTTSTTGPHSSNMANKLDPRVDSDADHRNNPASNVGGRGQAQGTYGGAGGTTTAPGYGAASSATGTHGTAGPHSSNMANKADPRIDSDMDHRNNPASQVGGYGQTQGTHGGTGMTTGGTGYGTTTTGTTGAHGHGTTGATHTGGIDSGYNGTTTGTPGTAGMQSTKVHDSKLLNKLDPRTKTDSEGRAV